MKTIIANPGSTSYKCKLYDTDNMDILFEATVERIGSDDGIYSCKFQDGETEQKTLAIPDYFFAVQLTLDSLKDRYSIDEIKAVGFKTVHAKGVTGCVELTDDVLQAMEDYRPLAPVHTDVYINAISVFQKLLQQNL